MGPASSCPGPQRLALYSMELCWVLRTLSVESFTCSDYTQASTWFKKGCPLEHSQALLAHTAGRWPCHSLAQKMHHEGFTVQQPPIMQAGTATAPGLHLKKRRASPL